MEVSTSSNLPHLQTLFGDGDDDVADSDVDPAIGESTGLLEEPPAGEGEFEPATDGGTAGSVFSTF